MCNEKEFNDIVKDILNNSEFKKLEKEQHHGTTRLKHSINVAKVSFIIAKKLKYRNYKEITRASLLHDFFYEDDINKVKSIFVHSKKAANKAKKIFNISDLEYSMIESHMFPFTLSYPKNKESWVLITTDKIVSIYDLFKLILPPYQTSPHSSDG